MEIWMINLLGVFVLSMFLSAFLIPKILLIASTMKLYDGHNERKIHQGEVPRLGGLSFIPVIAFSVVLVIGINLVAGRASAINYIAVNSMEMCFQFCGLVLLFLVGIADDLMGVRYVVKFFAQMLSGILLVVGGVWINSLHGLIGVYEMPVWIGYALTVLIVVFFSNAINLIDGVDGLASGLSALAAALYCIAFIERENYMYAAIALALLGVLIPFFIYNVFGKASRGNKIFMGDTGALTIGFLLTILSVKLFATAGPSHSAAVKSFTVAFAPMFIPCFDVLRVFFRRIRNHKSPFLPDLTHIHHKLLAIGFSSRMTMVFLIGLSLLITVVNVLVSSLMNVTVLLLSNLGLWTLFNVWITWLIRRKGDARSPFFDKKDANNS